MQIGSHEWARLIADGAEAFGLALTDDQLRRFARHAAELVAWNAVSNLTAITRPEEIARNHFLDSLAAAGLVAPGSRLLDVGTGGGFPGLPLHVAIPGLATTLIDSSRKKVSFLRHAVRAMGLGGVEALNQRLEDFARRGGAGRVYDTVVSRAAVPLEAFVRLAVPLLDAGGQAIAYKGAVPEAEMAALARVAAASVPPLAIARQPYCLPGLRTRRELILVRRGGTEVRGAAR
jgi:16S rRNA (guanine527-N7)-methyltransferase